MFQIMYRKRLSATDKKKRMALNRMWFYKEMGEPLGSLR